MRTYLILKEKARQWNNDPDVKSILAEIAKTNSNGSSLGKFEKGKAASLLAEEFDRASLASKGLQYERLEAPSRPGTRGRTLQPEVMRLFLSKTYPGKNRLNSF